MTIFTCYLHNKPLDVIIKYEITLSFLQDNISKKVKSFSTIKSVDLTGSRYLLNNKSDEPFFWIACLTQALFLARISLWL